MIRIVVLIFFLVPGSQALAQIQGDVLDRQEKGIAGAMIIATGSTNRADTVRSDYRGFYEFKNLKPGKYRVEVKAAGFQPAVKKNIEVKVEDTGKVEDEDDLYRGQRLDFDLIPARSPTSG